MSTSKKDIEYEFEDLRRNTDALPTSVTEQLEVDDDTGAVTDVDDTDDNDDEEMVPLSEVNKRIDKVRRESNRQIATAKDEATTVIADLTKRVSTMEEADEVGELETEHKANVERINKSIEEAMESGESKDVTRLTTELAELTATNVTKREELKRKRAADEHDEPDDLNKKSETGVIPRAKDWLAEQDWWDDPDNAHIQRYVKRVDMALQEKGYSPHDDDYYEKLEETVEKKYPGMIIHTMDEDALDLDDEEDELDAIPTKRSATKKKARRSASRQPVGGKDAAGGRKRPSQRGKTLNRGQIANMRMFGMDPDNKDHVEAYMEGAGMSTKGGK